jgi:methionyl-tRNA formyltransferase
MNLSAIIKKTTNRIMTSKRIKIVYMGTPPFALAPMQSLLNNNEMAILAVVTQSDKKAGRNQELTPPPVKIMATRNELPVLQPESLRNNPEFVQLLKNLKPDFIVVVAYGQILPEEILNIPKYGCINIHPSLLPKYRGATPIEEALLNGDKQTGVSFIKMSKGLDSGDILFSQRLNIDPSDDALTLRQKLSLFAAASLPYVLKDVIEGNITPIPQNNANATHCRKINKEDGLIDPSKMEAQEIINRLKAYTPWPSIFLIKDNKRLKVLEAETTPHPSKKTAPWQLQRLPDGKVAIGTKSGLLVLKKVQPEGKKPMPIQDFLNGNRDFFINEDASPK